MSTGSVFSRLKRNWNRTVVRRKRRVIRYSLLTANTLLLVGVVFFVAKTPSQATDSVQQENSVIAEPAKQAVVSPLDKVSSADIAVNVARTVGLPEMNSVTNHADSVNAASATVAADSAVVAKPQVVANALPSKYDIQTYVAKEGDTISSIAAKLGVSSDSIRWSNNLSGDAVAAGTRLVLPPSGVNGLVYTVESGDTPESLAQKFSTDKQLIITYNDAEISGLKVGEQILIPDGVLTAVAVTPAVRSSYSATTSFAWGGSAPVYSANGYDYGWCTWHAANRRQQTGNPIPSNLGNAISWYGIAASAGLPVGSTPRAGAVLWHANIGGLGHVAYVEKVNDDGSMLVSDMNYPIWGTVTYRTVPSSEIGSYRFIY
jgi:surface antigen